MRNRSLNTALAGAIAAALAFVAVPAQIVTATDASARVHNAKLHHPKNAAYYHHDVDTRNWDFTLAPRNGNPNCMVDVWGTMTRC
ncbi:MAG: hypothetical protein WA384_18815 [Rhodomicrobium sp.]